MSELEYVRANYCDNRDVATGNYDCPYATTVMNTICCTGQECNYKGIYNKPSEVVNNSVENEHQISIPDEEDACFSCPYFNPVAPDCCSYSPEACYYDADYDNYPF